MVAEILRVVVVLVNSSQGHDIKPRQLRITWTLLEMNIKGFSIGKAVDTLILPHLVITSRCFGMVKPISRMEPVLQLQQLLP
ncbi:hypothetical protein I7I53_04507 [Histoplasma capsulatum var. duboisii H88]|uniref:Uncharacterized protein n=1 Tax=Ajellomyces capsulatus (strain H88) TaxID=544711 RepID=A0A8A1LQM5_AJEC8|nr:hypothetical protein I7I53_04507 [Histoplasma capsulatum var. duboisii H88]